MISVTHKGSFNNTERFLKSMMRGDPFKLLDRFGREGVAALSRATPKDDGESANAWSYSIEQTKNGYSIVFTNDHMAGDSSTPVVILLQYGHGTGTGGYVEGRDFINPAIQPVFDKIADEAWKAVKSA